MVDGSMCTLPRLVSDLDAGFRASVELGFALQDSIVIIAISHVECIPINVFAFWLIPACKNLE